MLVYRVNLVAADVPLITDLLGRTVIVPSADQNYSRAAASKADADRNVGIPQAYYMHNVMPVDSGMMSVGYRTIAAPVVAVGLFNNVFFVKDGVDNYAYLATTTTGEVYALTASGLGWLKTTSIVPAADTFVTVAIVNGNAYIYWGKLGAYRYDFASNTLIAVPLLGLDTSKILGICASNGYMIAWTSKTVHWSSIISPTDFVPSLVNGSGGGGVQASKGAITVCLPQSRGFIVYTRKNAVSALYTNNPQYPFTYVEIVGAGGLADPSLVASDSNTTRHIAFTSAGIQDLDQQTSTVIFPNVIDFIGGSVVEDYDDETAELIVTNLTRPLRKKLTIVSSRYFVFSYGINQLTHALVFDSVLSRWGKLKVSHVDCFEYNYPAVEVADAPRKSMAFLQQDGTVKIANLIYDVTATSGLVILGKYQYVRSNYLTLQQVDLELVPVAYAPKLTVLASLDGHTTVPHSVPPKDLIGRVRRYDMRVAGLNHSLVIQGAFLLTSVVLTFTLGGTPR